MDIKWYLKEEEYDEYRKNQQKCKEEGDDCLEGEILGNVRVGNLCFDILNWQTHLWFDLYVGGVDTGYGYSVRKEFEIYPYDFADSASFKWDEDVSQVSMEEFEKELSEYIEAHIKTHEGYVTDIGAIPVSLIGKANEELKLW